MRYSLNMGPLVSRSKSILDKFGAQNEKKTGGRADCTSFMGSRITLPKEKLFFTDLTGDQS